MSNTQIPAPARALIQALLAASVFLLIAPASARPQSVDLGDPNGECAASASLPDTAIFVGVVRDRATGRQLPGVSVELAGDAVTAAGEASDSTMTVRADSTGVFHLCGVRGAVSLRVRAWGTTGPIVELTPADAPDTTVVPVDLGPPGRITGTVLDHASSDAVEGARVVLPELGITSLTDSDGRFAVGRLPPRRVELRVEHIGHRTVRDTIRVRSANSVHLRVDLPTEAVRVAPLEVTVESVRPRWLESTGFYRRRERHSGGRFFTGAELRERGVRQLSQLFRRLPGFRLNDWGEPVSGRRAPSYATAGECGLQYVVNGQPALRGMDVNSFSPEGIAALELYRGGSQIPIRFNVRSSGACGVLVIWTRRQ